MAKYAVLLLNSAGEIDRHEFSIAPDHPDVDEAVNIEASSAIESWILSVGDTIKIVEA